MSSDRWLDGPQSWAGRGGKEGSSCSAFSRILLCRCNELFGLIATTLPCVCLNGHPNWHVRIFQGTLHNISLASLSGVRLVTQIEPLLIIVNILLAAANRSTRFIGLASSWCVSCLFNSLFLRRSLLKSHTFSIIH
jgi:hypothetical protein